MEFDNVQRRYVDAVGYALMAFQLIEEHLKERIAICYSYVSLKVSDVFPFEFYRADVKDSSMERLLVIFRKLSDDEELKSHLQRLPSRRNYCAHQGLLGVFAADDDPGVNHDAEIAKINAIAEDAWACLARLHHDGDKLRKKVNNALPGRAGA